MKVWAVSLMHDEADIAFHSVRHMFSQGVDGVLVYDNLSDDGTGDECFRAGAEVLFDGDPAHRQGAKMTTLARYAAEEYGAEWIVPFDADEIWHGIDLLRHVRGNLVLVHGYDYLPRRTDNGDENPFRRLEYRRPFHQTYPKVAFRWDSRAAIAEGNHHVWLTDPVQSGLHLRLSHFQYRSLEQMTHKVRHGAAAMDLAGMAPTEGAHWRSLAALDDAGIARAWETLLAEQGLVHDPVPL